MTVYLTIFYTDVVGISTTAVGTIFLVARLWDAVNDPIMGMIVDKTPFGKIGKFKKYLLLTPLPLAVIFVLCFINPSLSTSGKVIYASITYILYGMLYTIYEVPYWGFSSNITTVAKERNSLISVTKLFQVIGLYMPIILGLPLVEGLGKGNLSRGWFLTALLIGIVGLVTTALPGISIKERQIKQAPKKSSFKEFASIIKENKPIKILIIANLLLGIQMIAGTLEIYVWTYNIGREDLYPVFMVLGAIVSVVGSALAPGVIRLFGDKKKAILAVTIIAIISDIACFLLGYSNLVVFVALRLIDTVFALIIPLVIMQIMFADSIEYNEWKTGVRNEGTIFALKSFVDKFKLAISGAAGAYILTLINYVPQQVQSDFTLKALYTAGILIPTVGLILFAIVMKFYPLSDQVYEDIVVELETKI